MLNSPANLDATFAALSDPTRRAIVARLAEGRASVGELAEPFQISLPAVSRHIRVLEDAGLLERDRNGRRLECRLQPDALNPAIGWMVRYGRFWEQRLDNLERHLAASTLPRSEGDR